MHVRTVTSALATAALMGTVLVTAPGATATPVAVTTPSVVKSGWKPRPAQFTKTVTTKDIAIRMSDGVVLRGDLTRPARADGTAAPGKRPVIVTITAYNKTSLGNGAGSTLAGADPAYLVARGYQQLTVDARGTGSSEGEWCAFCTRENKDAGEIVDWASQQPWSNGRTAMTGASYMGISQLWAAAYQKRNSLKAIFPQVPANDVYRDVVASGGQVDVGFIPLWLGLVTATGLIPPAVAATDPASGLGALVSHATAGATFSARLLAEAALGGEPSYDGPFYRQRSPQTLLHRVKVPAFFIGGEFDLFQRGTPLNFENLQRRGVPTKLIFGPWDHLQGSSGADVGKAGYGSLAELQLRWFDHYVRGVKDPALNSDIAPLTWFEQGSNTWRRAQRWIGAKNTARTWKLSGRATTGGTSGGLTTGTPKAGRSTVLPIPVAGLCTRSMNQWTAGIPNATTLANPCLADNQLNDRAGVSFDTAPLTKATRFQGPINVSLALSSPTGQGMASVAVSSVAPDGTVTRLTGGWQVISHRALDTSRSRYLDGRLIQPFHPHTKAAELPLRPNAVQRVDVEVFPTGAVIPKGHRLRVAVAAYDVPHLAPTAVQLPGALSPLTIHTGPKRPSLITLPALR